MRKWILRIVLALFGLSILPVLVFRFIPPPTSAFILENQLQLALDGQGALKVYHHWVPLRDISPQLRLAVVASEDQTFPTNWGFDFEAISKAWHYNQTHRSTHGASTITQQTARNLFLWPSRTWIRKGLEVYFTLAIEALWPKRRILEVYLNIAQFGPRTYGADAAARRLLHRSPARLTIQQAALLAAVLPDPDHWLVTNPPPFLLQRAQDIQTQMSNLGANYLDSVMKIRHE